MTLRFEPLTSRRAGGDAGHVPGCAGDHALDTACSDTLASFDASYGEGREAWAGGDGQRALREMRGGLDEHHGIHSPCGWCVTCACDARPRVDEDGLCIFCGGQPLAVCALADGGVPHVGVDVDNAAERARIEAMLAEHALRRVQAARAALRENLRAGYALNEGQVATVLRVADALAAGVSLEAREALGREVDAVFHEEMSSRWREASMVIGERLATIGRASVVPPDADMARILAAWRWLCAWDRGTLRLNAERYVRAGIREVVERLFAKGNERGAVWVSLEFAPPPGVAVAGCDVGGQPATAEQWAKLRAAGVPVADGVGV